MACSCALKARSSGGDRSRTDLDLEKLMKAGWSVDKKGKSYVFVSPSPEERKFKSSKDVATYLESRGEYGLIFLLSLPSCSCKMERWRGKQRNRRRGLSTRYGRRNWSFERVWWYACESRNVRASIGTNTKKVRHGSLHCVSVFITYCLPSL